MVLAMSAVCGLARAATVINQNLVIAEYTKDVHVSSAVGLNMVSKGIFVLTVGRLLGNNTFFLSQTVHLNSEVSKDFREIAKKNILIQSIVLMVGFTMYLKFLSEATILTYVLLQQSTKIQLITTPHAFTF